MPEGWNKNEEPVLTPEVNLAIHAYSEKIFVKPFNQAIKGEE
jgi:hypothetical protein